MLPDTEVLAFDDAVVVQVGDEVLGEYGVKQDAQVGVVDVAVLIQVADFFIAVGEVGDGFTVFPDISGPWLVIRAAFVDQLSGQVVVVEGGAGIGDFACALAQGIVGIGGDEVAVLVYLEQAPGIVVAEGARAVSIGEPVAGEVVA